VQPIKCATLRLNPKAGYQWLIPVSLATQEAVIRRIPVQSQPQANNSQDPITKISNTKRTGRVAQVIQHLPSKREALISNTSTTKKKKKKSEL
jgi:hypothetical protein